MSIFLSSFFSRLALARVQGLGKAWLEYKAPLTPPGPPPVPFAVKVFSRPVRGGRG